ncbi:oxidoreductase [Mucilaginibacter endophyticus]|uniref:oxidoreductase n=1 Tax=Mucilaginibacter endophyticus TaxID=2675003 RepID=UPI000E0CDB69|nr:oxidoreductase [Mucilaginibacter endophyticus]
MKKVWFITGVSSGLGKELAKQVLAAGYLAAVGARKIEDVADIVAAYPGTSLALKLDVTNADEIVSSVKAIEQKFGRIDVLVNNAGIGYFGSIEESEETEVRRMFEINFFGLAKLTNEVLPIMRSQRSGHIVNISSILGLMSAPAVGFYSATKFAVDGYSESLSKEVAPLGIKVSIIAPSNIRTDWAGRSANETSETMADYQATAGIVKNHLRSISGRQDGDPVRMSAAILKIVASENPPLRLLLGNDSFNEANAKLVAAKADYDAWAETSVGADFPKEATQH